MPAPPDSDLRLGQIAVRMGLVAARDLPALLQEARSGHTTESAGRATSLAQVLLRRRLVSVSDYLYMARQARDEAETEAAAQAQAQELAGALDHLEVALDRYESGELDADSFEQLLGASSEPLERPADVRQRLGHYELIDEVARGGMGIVYRARDTRSGEVLALKVMIEADDDEVRLQRFEREAQLAACLDHPNIVRIHDAGRVEGMPYFTMDLVDGDSLDDLLERSEGLPRDLALRALAQTALAMEHAHARGIVHRDLKPGNILIERRTGTARVTDFGLARDLQRGTRLTQIGQAVGTPYYMAPEQVRGERDVDGRCDVYALGVILYEVLTGDVPFDADSPLSLFKKIDREQPVLPLDPARGIDERIHKIAMRALEKNREQRYGRATLLAEDLERYLRGEEPRALPHDWRGSLRRRLVGARGRVLLVALAGLALVVVAVAVGIGVDRLRIRRLRDEGERQAIDAIARADLLRQRARERLTADDAAGARDEAQSALAALAAATDLLADAGPRGAAARGAFEAREGEALRAALKGLLARAWLAQPGETLPHDALVALQEAVAAQPRDVELRLTLARALRRRGDLARAVQALDRALDVEPTHFEGLILRGELLLELGLHQRAHSDLLSALLRQPDSVQALILRSRALTRQGRLDSAAADATNARELAPGHAAAHVACGDVARAQGALAEALSSYRTAAALAPADPTPLLRRADLLAARGSFEEALEAYAAAEALCAGAQALMARASSLARLFQLEAAARLLSDAAKDGDGGARAAVLTALGVVRLAQGEEMGAREALSEAAVADPTTALPRLWLARRALAHDQGHEAARRLLGEVEARGPHASALLTLESRLVLASGQPERAVALAEQGLAAVTDGADARARRALAAARRATGGEPAPLTFEAAWEAAARGPELEAELLRQALELLPFASRRLGTIQREAEARLRAVLRLDPDRTRARAALGRLFLARGQLEDAWSELRRASREDPFRPEIARDLGQVALRLRRSEELAFALAATRRALEAHGATLDLLLLQADCQSALAQEGDALLTLERAANLAVDSLAVHERRARALEKLGKETALRLTKVRIDQLGRERDQRRAALFGEAQGLEATDPQQALELAREALTLSDAGRHNDHAMVARFVASLERRPETRLTVLAPTLTGLGWEAIDRADPVLAQVWSRPLSQEGRRSLLLRARDGGPADALAQALAGLYDGLAGSPDEEWLAACLAPAVAARAAVPAALAAHLARAYLRVRAGDAARGLREALAIQEVGQDSALYQFVLAEAAAACGRDETRDTALERARDRLPRVDERRQASRFLR